MATEIKVCEQCGCNYEHVGDRASRFCSRGCAMRFRVQKGTTMYNRVCKKCGKEFTSQYPNKLYCQMSCNPQTYALPKKVISEDERRKNINDRNLYSILMKLNVDEFCDNFIIHHWQDGDAAEKARLENLNPHIDFRNL